ncbi:hypothetical protein ACFPRL_23140 [Pseudoclavibacter helvolus]
MAKRGPRGAEQHLATPLRGRCRRDGRDVLLRRARTRTRGSRPGGRAPRKLR